VKFSATTKLSGRDDLIREYLDKQIPGVCPTFYT